MTFLEILSHFPGVRKPNGKNGFMVPCPAHGDGKPSLSISPGNGSGPLFKCFAGCDTENVLAASGLTWQDVLPPKEREITRKPAPAAASRAPGKITRYDIRDAGGKLVAIHVREDHVDGKRIWWELPDRMPNLGGIKLADLPLYGIDRLPTDAKEVILTEGEKAADALTRNGIAALGTVTGASGTPGDDALRPLLSHPVFLWPDNDEPGRKHMNRIGTALLRLGHDDVRDIDWKGAPEKGDAADLFALEGARDDFDALTDEARPFIVVSETAATSLTPEKTAGPEAGVPLYVRNAADIVPVPVSWLWRERLPAGKLVVFAGEPGQGKSRASLSVAAIISRAGFWPAYEGRAEQGEVLIANFEDDEADTSVPRLQAERADLSKIRFLEGVPGDKGRRAFDLTLDTDRLAAHLDLYPKTRLLIVDPISACMGGTDSHRNAEVRGVLQPLADVAKQYGVCVIAITHLNKGAGTKALHRVIGSIAFTAAARVVFAIARDEDDPDAKRTLFLPIKNNLGNDRTGLSFSTTVTQLPSGIYAPRIEWGDNAITTTADEALSEPDEEQGAGRVARDFLRQLLAAGPMTAKAIQKEAQDAGITQATLRRAREKLGAKVDKDGLGPWTWSLTGGKS